MAEAVVGNPVQLGGQSASVGEISHQQKHRDDCQTLGCECGRRFDCQQGNCWLETNEDACPNNTDDSHRNSDWDVQKYQQEHGCQAEETDQQGLTHELALVGFCLPPIR